jgi:hypothetical protein
MPWNFDQPGNVNDFSDPAVWHKQLTAVSGEIIQSLAAEILGKGPEDVITDDEVESLRDRIGYVDPTKEEPPASAETTNIQAWGGFPRAVERRNWSDIINDRFDPNDPTGRYRAVEMLGDEDHREGVFVDRSNNRLELPVRHRQDEYLEWAVANDGRSIAFVSEGYDYFASLFSKNPQRVVDLYHEFTGDESITADDLIARQGVYRLSMDGERIEEVVKPGEFNPRNIHNIKQGIVHLSHRANSLSAEVFLAGTSALARTKADGNLLSGDDAEELLCCNLGGGPNRNSDPIISQAGYRLILNEKRYTLANPVGLYIADVDFDALLLPNNEDPVPRDWWHAVRGEGFGDPRSSRVLRLELRIPQTETFNGRPLRLSDLKIGGGNLAYPGQVAELIKVHLFVTFWDRSGSGSGPNTPCIGTCCKRVGTPLLFATDIGCKRPQTDAFPGLIGAVTVSNSMTGRSAPSRSDSRSGSM